MTAFGLDASRAHAALLAVPVDGVPSDTVREDVAECSTDAACAISRPHGWIVRRSSSRRRPRTTSWRSRAGSSRLIRACASVSAGRRAGARSAVRSSRRALRSTRLRHRSLLYDLGSLELLLSLPDGAPRGVRRPRARARGRQRATGESLAALLDAGCKWSEAAETLGVHRHTLRYRMDRLKERTGRHPDASSGWSSGWLRKHGRRSTRLAVETKTT